MNFREIATRCGFPLQHVDRRAVATPAIGGREVDVREPRRRPAPKLSYEELVLPRGNVEGQPRDSLSVRRQSPPLDLRLAVRMDDTSFVRAHIVNDELVTVVDSRQDDQLGSVR